MKALFLTLLLSLLAISPTKGEALPTYGLDYLVYYGPCIFTATLVQEPLSVAKTKFSQDRIQRFALCNVLRADSMEIPDTIVVSMNAYSLAFYELNRDISSQSDTFLIFGDYDRSNPESRIFHPVASGIRAFMSGDAFVPWQGDFTYRFFRTLENTPLHLTIELVRNTIERFREVEAMRATQPLAAQNRVLLDWVRGHLNEFKTLRLEQNGPPTFNHWTGWGEYPEAIFNWIDENDIWKDAWEGMQLSKSIDNRAYSSFHIPSGLPFCNPEARAFLMQQIRDTTEYSMVAVQVLNNSLWGDYEHDAIISPEEQSQIIQLGLSLLEDTLLRHHALYLVLNASRPYDYDQQYRRNRTALPVLEAIFNRTPEGYFKKRMEEIMLEMKNWK